MHAAAPSPLYGPAGQAVQAPAPAREYVLLAHGEHEPWPAVAVYVPGAHTAHAAAPAAE